MRKLVSIRGLQELYEQDGKKASRTKIYDMRDRGELSPPDGYNGKSPVWFEDTAARDRERYLKRKFLPRVVRVVDPDAPPKRPRGRPRKAPPQLAAE